MSFLIFKSFADLVKSESIRIDNGWFVLHYRASVILMAVSSVLIGTTQYFGEPINCEVNNFDKSMVDTYCWTHGTWTVAEFLTKKMEGVVAHPGVGPYDPRYHTMIHHRYYQWVPIVIALSAVLFYVPRYLWKMFEGGWIANMCKDMKYPSHQPGDHSQRVKTLYQFYVKNHRKHRTYGFMFAFCEFLNLLNVILQWIMADVFMRGRFHDYGSNALYYFRFQSDIPDAFNPCDLVFPKMAKCSFAFYGGSGDPSKSEPLCILPQNVLNEKVALLVWFWFICLIVCSTLAVMIRLVVMMVPVARKPILFLYSENNNSNEMSMVCDNCGYGDWFILRQMKKNVDALTFASLISLLSKDTEQLMLDESNLDPEAPKATKVQDFDTLRGESDN
ncbi:hypothetical protein TCAL_00996 [Tigriopus californicus]|uniref:Innexin n=1 Tax=Tigriopus californicus TaxID=6832 RepID=A0A553P4E6_TIGCA|nr:innexin inx2-like [Tigriopus californicus]TRY72555.1 hypothetical protein TCAL_00996 [Tigriopus californicus]|eukprot:TCALIF_00996-PA protein Name:"Similar to Inx2 Innexin inx2 (Drosophila melanogaster)" AED:0.03 eAED:0.03 QI:62/1/1/1/1/1/2/71/388